MAVLQLWVVGLDGVQIGLVVAVGRSAVVPLDAVGVAQIGAVVGAMVVEPACSLSAFSSVRGSLMYVLESPLELAKRTLVVSLAVFSSFEVAALVPLVGFPWQGGSCPRCRKQLVLTFV